MDQLYPSGDTDVVAQAQPDVPRFERVAVLLAVGSCLIVLAIGLALYLAKFQVDGDAVSAALAVVAVVGLGSFFRSTPAAKLTPTERMIRSKRAVFALIGVLSGAAVLGAIAAAAELDTLGDWLMFAFIASAPLGVIRLMHTGFGVTNGRRRSE